MEGSRKTSICLGFAAERANKALKHAGKFSPRGSAYGSIYFTLLGLHHAHVLLGILIDLAVLIYVSARGLTNYWLIGVRALAIFCYEQARELYLAQAGGATSGGEAMAMMNEANDRGLGRKIWLLKSEGS